MFQNRKLLVATKHEKEKIVGPLLESELGVICMTDASLDTDVLGTFTGEVERILDPVSAAREKCRLGAEVSGCDLVLASEGSFGPHPSVYFISANQEILLLVDRKNNIEILASELSVETNFNAKTLYNEEALSLFAEQAGFPEHGLIIRKSREDTNELYKGIRDPDQLYKLFGELIGRYGSLYVETDMRAMHNPTRREVIKKAAEKLIRKIQSVCPECNTPGFGITGAEKGLICWSCGFPTDSVKAHLFTCGSCGFQKQDQFPNQKELEDPMYCSRCNP